MRAIKYYPRLTAIAVAVVVILALASECSAQNVDSLKRVILTLQYRTSELERVVEWNRTYQTSYDSIWSIKTQDVISRLERIETNLHKSHRVFNSGTSVFIVGLGASALGFIMHEEKASRYLIGTGGALVAISGIIHIHSHMWIGKASGRSGKATETKAKLPWD